MRHALAAALGLVLATGACTSILGTFDDSAAQAAGGTTTSTHASSPASTATSSGVKACSTNADCAPSGFCDTSNGSGTCVPRLPQAAACSGGEQCSTGACVDGVCCNGPCTGACMACEASLQQAGGGGTGFCSPAAEGAKDPRGVCAMEATSTCATDGKCKGGVCAMWPAGTPCGSPTCVPGNGGTPAELTAATSCDAAGACTQSGGSSACEGYTRCAGDACGSTCAAPSDCANGYACSGGVCLANNGIPCHAGSACQSGFCTDGVCCTTPCDGPCEQCGMGGSCNHVASGPSPPGHPSCAVQAMSTCGSDGTCHDGACEPWASGTPCSPSSCSAGVETVSTCDGKGNCKVDAQTSPCGAFACNPAGTACNTTCSTSADCSPPHTCVGTNCM